MTGPESRAGWSEDHLLGPAGSGGARRAGDGDPAAAPAFATPAAERYHEVAAAGRGGMGVVAMTHDRRLGRTVALKRVADDLDDPEQRARLMREAAITSRLEHPGIVAVHDAGVDADGAPYYTMRLIRGGSLQAALAGASDLDARLGFVRPLLATTEAVAYAHARGIAHGDLKPGNVMVGDFGETQLVDWGAARILDDAEDDLASDPALAAARGGDHAGTPAYLSPERARGEPSDRASDVWALGAILFEIVTGRPLWPDGDRAALFAILRGAARPLPPWPPGVPVELAAIAARALAWSPVERYPDAAAMADDLRRYLDGRRVHAHAYSSLELARRLVRAWRWPLAVVLAAAVAGAVALAATWRRIERHRTRAIVAEQATARALAEARATLGAALASRSVAAFNDGLVAEAEVLAAHALTRGESPEARGVLAATAARDRPEAVSRRELGGCRHAVPGDLEHALCLDDGALALWRVAPHEEARWRHPEAALAATVIDGRLVVAWTPRSELVVFELETGALRQRVPISRPRTLTVEPTTLGGAALYHSNHAVFAVDVETAVARGLGEPCGGQRIASLGVGVTTIVVVCWDGAVRVGGQGGVFTTAGMSALRAPSRPATAVTISADERTIAIGASDGAVEVIERATWTATPVRTVAASRVDQLRFVAGALAVIPDEGGVALWSTDLTREQARLPAAIARHVQVAGSELITTGAGWVRWRPPAPTRRPEVTAPAGYGTLAVSAASGWRAGGRGDGVVDLWRDDPATPVRRIRVSDVVVKQVTFSADGGRVAIAVAGAPGLLELPVDGAAALPLPVAAQAVGCCARVELLPDGTVLGFHYDARRTRWRGDARVAVAPLAIDAARTDAGELVTLGPDGAVTLGTAASAAFTVAGGLTLTASPDGAVIAVGLRDRVEVRGRGGDLRWTATAAAAALALAISPDGRWLVAGGADGGVRIWRLADGALAATLHVHGGRVEALAFDGPHELWTASWDGSARRWDLAGLDAEPAALVEASARRWPITLAQALAAGGPSAPRR